MEIVINIPDEQIEKSLAESKYILENEGEKGSVNIVLLYTNKKLEFVDIVRKTDYYSLTDKYTVLPKGHGDLVDRDEINGRFYDIWKELESYSNQPTYKELLDKLSMCLNTADTIIEADKE